MSKKSGKRLVEFKKKIAKKQYNCTDAFEILTKNANDRESIDVVFVLGINGKKSDQVVKGVIEHMPAGLGKDKTVAMFTKSNIKEAESAGAKYVGFEDLIQLVKDEEINPDVFMATRDVMPELAKLGLGRILKGKMPNPKFGTVIDVKDIEKSIKAQKAGQLSFRSNGSLVHSSIGRANFKAEDLTSNLEAMLNIVAQVRPNAVKPHNYLKRIFVSSTMGPSIQIDCATYAKGVK